MLRNRLDPADGKSRTGGAQFIPGVRVDALIREGNKVTGVQAGDDILKPILSSWPMASTQFRTIAGDGPCLSAHHYAVGVKELIGLLRL